MNRYRKDWNELARREPYFAVLTDPKYLSGQWDEDARREFFRTGDDDAERFLTIVKQVRPGIHPESALDFGCGVGRITTALGRRIARVTGVDASPEMIALAEANAAGMENVDFTTALDDRRFDLVCSLLVFQHIPVAEGLEVLSELLRRLAPGGVAALHFTLERPGGVLRRMARALRARSALVHRLAQRLAGDRLELPYMQMNEYPRGEIERRIRAATGREPVVIPHDEGEIRGAIFVALDGRAAAPVS